MIKIRSLLLLVDPDHEFTMRREDTAAFEELAQVIILACSCKWRVRRAVPFTEIDHGYSTILTQEWAIRERLNHLLDQDLTVDTLLEVIANES